jgi:hypothetical protein
MVLAEEQPMRPATQGRRPGIHKLKPEKQETNTAGLVDWMRQSSVQQPIGGVRPPPPETVADRTRQ